MSESLLKFKNVSKEYYGNKVLKNINLELKKGEIHALIGENGAGKSTLMNVLFGMPVIHSTGGYEGEIEIDGKVADIKSPHKAMEYGIGMVHQEFMLIPGFTITENIKINREILNDNIFSKVFGEKLKTLDVKKMNEDARKALDTLDMDIEEYSHVAGLPVGHMQFIEIAREIDKKGVKILVFDEPTAVLAEAEAQNLLKAMKKLAATGIGIIFISHRLDEIIDVADRVTVLRDGEHVATKDIKDTSAVEIAQLMIGRKVTIDKVDNSDRQLQNEVIMELKNLKVAMPGERIKGIDLKIKKGEIVGIGGLAGQGKLGIANGVMGMYPTTGEVVLNGTVLPLNDPRSAIQHGIGFVSEDRKGVGLLLDESIELNIAFTDMQINGSFVHNVMGIKLQDTKKIRSHAQEMIKDLDIRCISSQQHTGRLSGGNQQKVCIAKALTQNPTVLFVSEPTRGIDIGAKKLVLDLLLDLNRKHGMTIIMTSSELAELRSICDEIVIVCEGKVAGVLAPDASDIDFGLMMSGSKKHERSNN